jgi:hypothetical protein
MTIAEVAQRGKAGFTALPRDILVVAILVLCSTASFGLGLLAGRDLAGEGGGFSISELPLAASSLGALEETKKEEPLPAGGQVVGSKNGSKYHLPWCSGAKTIIEANKVWFASKEVAEQAGYTPAGNCKGL